MTLRNGRVCSNHEDVQMYYKVDLPIPGWFGDMMVDIEKNEMFASGFHAMWNFNLQSDISSTVRLFKNPDNYVKTTFFVLNGPPSNDAVFKILQPLFLQRVFVIRVYLSHFR